MSKNRSVMQHQFSQVPAAEIARSSFDRSHGLKTTFDAGLLIPIFIDECLPGDTFNLSMTGFSRLATPIFPVMDNMFMETFFFAIPNRLIWENWERFNGAQDNPDSLTDFTVPIVNVGGSGELSINDYFGIPQVAGTFNVNALWHRAYNLVWNEWFRDQNLQIARPINIDDGPDSAGDYPLQRRGKRHDYFTSALPWPQKGDTVNLPLGTTAPVVALSADAQPRFGNTAQDTESHIEEGIAQNVDLVATLDGQSTNLRWATSPDATGLMADLTNATASTINQLRQAFQIQKLQERDARGGTRYTEIVRAHFGVTSPDARLQRPEYLGGGSSPVSITPVPSTVPVSETGGPLSPQGSLAGYGVAQLANHGFTKSFTEHCVLLGLISVRADITYQQGLNKMFSRQTRFDFFWPALHAIGEQAILNREIYAQGDANDELVFGYQERYAEYRYKPSQITGLFRSAAAESLDSWHLSQNFSTLPVLNASFIQDAPPVDRVIAVQDEPHFLFDAYFSLRCARPMPVYGVPGLIDHF